MRYGVILQGKEGTDKGLGQERSLLVRNGVRGAVVVFVFLDGLCLAGSPRRFGGRNFSAGFVGWVIADCSGISPFIKEVRDRI